MFKCVLIVFSKATLCTLDWLEMYRLVQWVLLHCPEPPPRVASVYQVTGRLMISAGLSGYRVTASHSLSGMSYHDNGNGINSNPTSDPPPSSTWGQC